MILASNNKWGSKLRQKQAPQNRSTPRLLPPTWASAAESPGPKHQGQESPQGSPSLPLGLPKGPEHGATARQWPCEPSAPQRVNLQSSGAARRPGALCFAALCLAVFPRAVCSVLCLFCPGVLVRAVVRRCAPCCVCPGVSRCALPVLRALCCAVFRCAGALAAYCSCGACCCWRLVLWFAAVCCAVSFSVLWCGAGSGGPWSSAGRVFRCRCPCLAAWSGSLWLVWFAVVPCLPVSCSVVLCCLVVLCCCVLLSFCGAVCACFAHLWPVVPWCAVLLVICAVLCPVAVSVCCGALSLPAGTHKNIDYDPVLPRARL